MGGEKKTSVVQSSLGRQEEKAVLVTPLRVKERNSTGADLDRI